MQPAEEKPMLDCQEPCLITSTTACVSTPPNNIWDFVNSADGLLAENKHDASI